MWVTNLPAGAMRTGGRPLTRDAFQFVGVDLQMDRRDAVGGRVEADDADDLLAHLDQHGRTAVDATA
ncbi:MAG: hypothetical protein QOI25_3788 [Mycobacterium sp.]|nr:hypothetical protein [Mycobacterium sp.]